MEKMFGFFPIATYSIQS